MCRRSVRKTGALSCALPMKRTPSSPRNRARYFAATSSLRCFFSKLMTSIPSTRANESNASTNALVIGAMSADEAKVQPRYWRKNQAIPRSHCNSGTTALMYMRSIPSSSSVTWLRSTSATLCASVIWGSDRHRSLGTIRPLSGPGRKPILGSVGAPFPPDKPCLV